MEEKIINSLKKIVKGVEISLEYPDNLEFGDYTTNAALILAKKKGQNPREVAQKIVEKLKEEQELVGNIVKIEVAGAGFINFYLSTDALLATLADTDKQKNEFGKSEALLGQKIMLEFAHPNTHKLFHIGHLRNITTGESLARILSSQGASVIRVNYQGDVGMHIAKAIWGIQKLGLTDSKDVSERMVFLGKAYSLGNTAYEEGGEKKEEIEKINQDIYGQKDKKILKLYQETREWSLTYFDQIYKKVNTKFDRLYFESETAGLGKEIALEAVKMGVFKKSQGAIIFPGKKFGLHDRVFITSQGVPTYEAKDLGLARIQMQEYSPDKIIHLVGPEQAGYFQVLFKALETLDPSFENLEVHLPYGWVSLKEGKMSSRSGNVVTGEWLLDSAREKISKKYKSEGGLAAEIALGAVKYSFLKVSLTQEVAFDFDQSISMEGNSGPYLQYTLARSGSVLKKGKVEGQVADGVELTNEEEELLRLIGRFSGTISKAAQTYSPNVICNYLYLLAQKFNTFYNKDKIIGSKKELIRLQITKGVNQVLKNGLTLLAIPTPEKM